MKNLKKAMIASLGVQCALATSGLFLSWLPAQMGQGSVIALFPFVLGVPLGPMMLRPLVGAVAPDQALNLALVSALVSNFIVYIAIFYTWLTLRQKVSTLAHVSA
ncbi:MAG TPA: hypothetical protein VFZ34_15725 [Blastocatellia bacterium]|nr:hypothetical protein [Blastocatellia bacterium]